MYLPEKAVLSLLTDLSSLSCHDSHILLHTVNTKEITNTNKTTSSILDDLSSKMVFGVDEPHQLLCESSGNWKQINSYDYTKITSLLHCEGYLTDVTTNSQFTTAVFSKI
jgi:hypothetical protein